MYKCVFGENLVKIAPQELLVAAEAIPPVLASLSNVSLIRVKIHNLTKTDFLFQLYPTSCMIWSKLVQIKQLVG